MMPFAIVHNTLALHKMTGPRKVQSHLTVDIDCE